MVLVVVYHQCLSHNPNEYYHTFQQLHQQVVEQVVTIHQDLVEQVVLVVEREVVLILQDVEQQAILLR